MFLKVSFVLHLAAASIVLCPGNSQETFTTEFQWSFINFTWENEIDYNDAITTGRYIPENNAMAGIKIYKDNFYIAMPRIRDGTPVTLGYISSNAPNLNPLITPFPSWEANSLDACNNLENVQSMEIDQNGIMWVIDGLRTDPKFRCPSKLILYDLNDNAKIVHTFEFPEGVSGGFLNDIVVDGDFAYITDTSSDPGLIVYSRSDDRVWKFRDASMLGEQDATDFVVDGIANTGSAPIDGIALGPCNGIGTRYVYYCALTAFDLYAIGTDILQNEELASGEDWKLQIYTVGQKQAQSDGLAVDDQNYLYYGLLPLYGVGKWNISQSFNTSEIVEENDETLVWTDSFAFDNKGYLYLLTDHINRYFNQDYHLELTDEIKFRIMKLFTSSNSYLFNC